MRSKRVAKAIKQKVTMGISEDSSNSSTEDGNTIHPPNSVSKKTVQISPSKRWCFTLNNYTEEHISSLVPLLSELVSEAVVSKEVGESGTPHLQGYLKFKVKKRPKALLPTAHWEKARGTSLENYHYCTKENDPFWVKGFPEPVSVIEPNYHWEKEILSILQNKPDDRTINWYWSAEGGVGKTSFCKYLCVKHKALILGGKASDVRNGIVEYMKAHNDVYPKLIIMDIPRSYNSEFLSYEGIECVKNGLFFSRKYEGRMVCANAPHLFVFSNEEPNESKCSPDRWNIREIEKEFPTGGPGHRDQQSRPESENVILKKQTVEVYLT